MTSLPRISTEAIRPELQAERKIWPRPARPELFLQSRPMPFRLPRRQTAINQPSSLQQRIRARLWQALPWPLDRKRQKRS